MKVVKFERVQYTARHNLGHFEAMFSANLLTGTKHLKLNITTENNT